MEYIPDSLYICDCDVYQYQRNGNYWSSRRGAAVSKNFLMIDSEYHSDSNHLVDVKSHLVDVLGEHRTPHDSFDMVSTGIEVTPNGTVYRFRRITYDYQSGVFFLHGTDKYYTFDHVYISFDGGKRYITFQQYLANIVGEDQYSPDAASLVATIKLILDDLSNRFYKSHALSHDILLSGNNIGVPPVVTLKCNDGVVTLHLSSCIFTDLVNSPLRSTTFNVDSLILGYPCSVVRDVVKILYATDISDLYSIAGHDWENGVFDMYAQIFGILGFDWYTELFTRITTSDAYVRLT